MKLNELGQQFKGRKFGELILHHVNAQDYETLVKAMLGTIEELPSGAETEVESWIDEIAPLGKSPAFWQRDCGQVFLTICGQARQKLANCGVKATENDLLTMFQIIVLNFAYGAHKDPESKAFIQKSVGIGFLRRIFS